MCVILLSNVVYSHFSLSFPPVIHPDKCPHERAPESFDILKKANRFFVAHNILNSDILTIHKQAESELSDKDKREELNAVTAFLG
jgi:hypothetical protein